jgi:hypothetical protein
MMSPLIAQTAAAVLAVTSLAPCAANADGWKPANLVKALSRLHVADCSKIVLPAFATPMFDRTQYFQTLLVWDGWIAGCTIAEKVDVTEVMRLTAEHSISKLQIACCMPRTYRGYKMLFPDSVRLH